MAAEKVDIWVRAAGADRTLYILTPIIAAAEPGVNEAGEKVEDDKILETSARILTESVRLDPTSYSVGVDGKVLAKSLAMLFEEFPSDESEFAVAEEQDEVRLQMFDDLILLGDKSLTEDVRAHFPLEKALTLDSSRLVAFPNVRNFISETMEEPGTIGKVLAKVLVSGDFDTEEMFKKANLERFGDPFQITWDAMKVLASDDTQTYGDPKIVNNVLSELWVEMMDNNHRKDPRLGLLRERLLSRDWYWDIESNLLTLVDTVDALGIEQGKEKPFIIRHEDEIFRAFSKSYNIQINQELTKARDLGIFSQKLADFVGIVRKAIGRNFDVDTLIKTYPDELMTGYVGVPLSQ